MVFHKRLVYGSNGHEVPPIPRVPLCARGKRSARKKIDDKQMSPFDLLATVAGELLSKERENTLPTLSPAVAKGYVKKEHVSNEKPFKPETFDQGSCNKSTADSEKQTRYDLKECSLSPGAKGKDARESMVGCKMSEFDIPKDTCIEGCYYGMKATSECKSDIGIKTPLIAERRMIGSVINGNGLEILEDLMDVDAKPPALVSSDSSVEVHIPRNGSFLNCGNGVPVDRDDGENSSGCTHPRSNIATAYKTQRIGDRRIRKMPESKFWEVAPTLKDGELSNTEMKPIYRNRKLCYTRGRTQRCSFKRRKLFERRSVSASDLDIYGKGISNLPNFSRIKMETTDAHASLSEANGASSSTSGQKSSHKSGDYHVKLNIKSFKVPELFIEIPENATVGSLKRTVMEAVTAILGGGLRVGVLLQGKKVRDDNKTLLQAGISHNDKMDNLGFTLEPSAKQAPPQLLCPENPNSIIPNDVTQPLKGIQAPTTELAAASEDPPQAPQTSVLNCPESDHDSVHSPSNESSADRTADSKSLVPVPAGNIDALAVVPLHKSRRTELVQRRIRRPFSVSEVEALVQAVEKLGTGRWRDVKIRAFDNAKHRTYVDLKDKWKTLVHTARISPQQRRGEPVPQELLDRVLSAHARWSSQQAKAPPAEVACLLP